MRPPKGELTQEEIYQRAAMVRAEREEAGKHPHSDKEREEYSPRVHRVATDHRRGGINPGSY